MTYKEFLQFVQFVPRKCMYETIYEDSDGRDILVIKLLDAYGMVNKAQRQWVGLTDEEISALSKGHMTRNGFARNIEQALKEKNE